MSLGQLGQFTVLLAVGLAGYGIVTGLLGLTRRDGRLLASARLAAIGLFLALTAAVAVMETALLTDDFTVKYVAESSSIFSPLWVKIVVPLIGMPVTAVMVFIAVFVVTAWLGRPLPVFGFAAEVTLFSHSGHTPVALASLG